ncbi:mitogen-activated protein kinase 15 [Homalodisca vitripennis]|uniref:Mitogen-activated protein kinase n=1 Tax=Homalodisca liturata TaxID=320908 RepID=A0A1B6K2A3_9HEMI|nr:mitogen-activated protein kinase 15 [Homalodisca vitripennis]
MKLIFLRTVSSRFYTLIMRTLKEIDDHIMQKYDFKKRIGKGAYGIVWKAVDKKSKEAVAVKKIFDAFRNPTDAQRTFREIMFLQEFCKHPNIIRLHSVHRAINNKDIYLVFEYMETDLHNIIERGNILRDIHRRYITYQLLKALKYIHSGNVIHRDLKPSNILLNGHCHCKIADFGLARSVVQLSSCSGQIPLDPSLTDYVATRWYRAPEILVAAKRYTKGIDMWSIGCILAEMLLGKPLFPGTSTINQVEKIMATIEPPSPKDVESVCTGYGSSLLQRSPTGPRLPLPQLLHGSSPDALDLVHRLLVFNPLKRLTAAQALRHPYIARFHNASNEPALVTSIVPLLRDDVQLSVDEYRNKLYKVISRTERKTNKPCVKTDTNRKLSEPVMRAQTSRHTRRPIPTETVVVHKTPVPPRTATSNPARPSLVRRSSTGSYHSSHPSSIAGVGHRDTVTLTTIKETVTATQTPAIINKGPRLVKPKATAGLSSYIGRASVKEASQYSSYDQKYGYITASELQDLHHRVPW